MRKKSWSLRMQFGANVVLTCCCILAAAMPATGGETMHVAGSPSRVGRAHQIRSIAKSADGRFVLKCTLQDRTLRVLFRNQSTSTVSLDRRLSLGFFLSEEKRPSASPGTRTYEVGEDYREDNWLERFFRVNPGAEFRVDIVLDKPRLRSDMMGTGLYGSDAPPEKRGLSFVMFGEKWVHFKNLESIQKLDVKLGPRFSIYDAYAGEGVIPEDFFNGELSVEIVVPEGWFSSSDSSKQ